MLSFVVCFLDIRFIFFSAVLDSHQPRPQLGNEPGDFFFHVLSSLLLNSSSFAGSTLTTAFREQNASLALHPVNGPVLPPKPKMALSNVPRRSARQKGTTLTDDSTASDSSSLSKPHGKEVRLSLGDFASQPTVMEYVSPQGTNRCSICGAHEGHVASCSMRECAECGARGGDHTDQCSHFEHPMLPVSLDATPVPQIIVNNNNASTAADGSSSTSSASTTSGGGCCASFCGGCCGACCGSMCASSICCCLTCGLSKLLCCLV